MYTSKARQKLLSISKKMHNIISQLKKYTPIGLDNSSI